MKKTLHLMKSLCHKGIVKHLAIILLLLLCSQSFSQQTKYYNKNLAEQISYLSKGIIWPQNDTITKYHYVYYGNDSTLFKYLKNISKRLVLITHPFDVERLLDINRIPNNTHVLVVGRNRKHELDKIANIINGKMILLATDSAEYHSSLMINYLPTLLGPKAEMKQGAIMKAGLDILPIYKKVGPKYKADWEKIIAETDSALQKQEEQVKKQSEKISIQEHDINKKKEALARLGDEYSFLEADIVEKQQDLLMQKEQLIGLEEQTLTQKGNLEERKIELDKQRSKLEDQKGMLEDQEDEIANKTSIIESKNKQLFKSLEAIKKQKLIIYFFIIIGILFVVMLAFIIRSVRIKTKANRALEEKNAEISQQKEEIMAQRDHQTALNVELAAQKEEIEAQRDEIEAQRDMATSQRDLITDQKDEITSSILYAKRIQEALLPDGERLKEWFNDAFVFYHPRDIVSGDFYWLHQKNSNIYFSVGDCTGHGVPGAFMSVLSISLLNEIIQKQKDNSPGKVLNSLRELIIQNLQQEERADSNEEFNKVKDGLDMSLCLYDKEKKKLYYSGANNPIYIIRNNSTEVLDVANCKVHSINDKTLYEIKPDKMPVAIHTHMSDFCVTEIDLIEGDEVLLFSDGYPDQFGGEKGKKLKYKVFREYLVEGYEHSMLKQKEILESRIERWMCYKNPDTGLKYEQVDDICIIGVKV